jgi:hypothetical protein
MSPSSKKNTRRQTTKEEGMGDNRSREKKEASKQGSHKHKQKSQQLHMPA